MTRKIVIVLGVLLVAVIAIGAVSAQDDEEPFRLTIMHTNDVHGHHEPQRDGNGGAAREATVVNQIRDEVENSLLLDGGDRFTGTLFHQQWRGQDSVQIMNAIGYDAMTLGNHEFDDGSQILADFINGLNFPVVTANVDFSDNELLAGLVDPWVVLDVNGENVGIIGLVTPETEILSSPADDLVFEHDLIAVTQNAVDELTAMGVDKIILLTHIGFAADQMVAQGVSGVDIVVGGHTNTFLSNIYAGAEGEYPLVLESASGEPVLVVQASTATVYLGRLDVEFDANGVLSDWEGDAILLSRYITPDPEVSDIVAGLAEPIEELRMTPVGTAGVFLTGDRTVCRAQECNLGNLITDALRNETGAQITFQNAGGIRADIDEGEVTLGEVLTVLPFGNLVSTFELTGEEVIAALENGVSRITLGDDGLIDRSDLSGRFPQVSGIRYSYDASAEPGNRIVSVEVLNDAGEFEPIDPEAVYTVAANDFMRGGGDGYEVFVTAANAYDFGRPLDQVVAEYIEANSPVAPEVEGRITEVNGADR
ncbi:MAG: multifunctional 2',3'-cyclic-nucleotide 2'-phosphodiesterase/5'-nucleotidase/3'-nucleotidase [Chloroflexi bacterium]|nr:MAG: multifunctional 2',3'-cyclic-nucleotide 2'-phosphodiesterase/5'-nucleotidase/3'-nucleotidase [Chloroflexota bacterium]